MNDMINRQFKKLLLDTNAISNLAKNVNDTGKIFIDKFISCGEYIICVSPYTILELEKAEIAYEASKIFFGIMPCLITTSFKGAMDKEVERYKRGEEVNPILLGTRWLHKL